MDDILIRQETKDDYKHVHKVVEAAFKDEELSDHKEHILVDKLRSSESFIPELSLVATEKNDQIVGHILLTRIKIIDNSNNSKTSHDSSLALAPVSVHPDYQGRGIGSKLIISAHTTAKELGYSSIILLGHEKYYPRFGYKILQSYGIKLPFDVPPQNCMAVELVDHALDSVQGLAEYDEAFSTI